MRSNNAQSRKHNNNKPFTQNTKHKPGKRANERRKKGLTTASCTSAGFSATLIMVPGALFIGGMKGHQLSQPANEMIAGLRKAQVTKQSNITKNANMKPALFVRV